MLKKNTAAQELGLRHLNVMERITQINLSTERFEDVLSKLLELVLETFDADRASLLYPCDPEAPFWGVPMERTRSKWPGLFAMGVDMPQSAEIAAIFTEMLVANGPLLYGPFAPRPVPPLVAAQFSIKSQMQVVLRPKVGKPWLLVMHHCEQAQEYGADVVHLFSAVAKRISDTLSASISLNRLRESEERLQLVLAGANDGWWDWNLVANQMSYSPRWWAMLGYAPDELPADANLWRRLTHPDDMDPTERAFGAALNNVGQHEYTVEFRLRHKEGHYVPVLSRGHIRRNHDGKPVRVSGTNMDLTARKEAEQALRRAANYDALTQLPNRRMFHDLLEQKIGHCRRTGSRIALLFIDLDYFKEVNDTLGHHFGDLLLADAARRINAAVGPADLVARLGGDEFTIVLSDPAGSSGIDRLAYQVLNQLSMPFQLGQERAYVSASIGIALYPDDASDLEDLVKYADQAMYAAKRAGRNRYSYFTSALHQASEARMRMITAMHGALAEGQFRVYYQPIVELATGHVHKAEALLRWQHPERGLISPVEFIPIAEQTGMILEIGDWVFRQAAQQVKYWRATHDPRFQISVNASPVQFHSEDGQGVRTWVSHLRQLGLPGSGICFEITEGLLLDTMPIVKTRLLEFRDAGIQVALDDFGTGYSSLSYLKKFDIDYIKIDQSFVSNLEVDPDDRVLCEAIIVMAHKLGLKVIAEGVETEGQRKLLAEAGCDYVQGFLLAMPAPADEVKLQIRLPA
jgi:diguanylate cyclase (GGDEF)-like protein/PAS domain S-box-containing protein